MAIEIATAYVSLTTSAKGIKGSVSKDLAPVTSEATKVGDTAGKEAGKKFSSGMGGVVGTAAKGAAIFGGVEFVSSAFDQALDKAALPAKMQAEFGLTAPIAQSAAQTAGQLFASGWGESLDSIGQSVADTQRMLQALGTGEDVGKITTQAQALADTFGEEVNPLVTAAGQLVKTGLAPNMQAAMDVMTKGFQNGANSGQDLLDTITEYSGQFQKLGLDGGTAMGLINQGLQAGARNSDFVADAIKEFSIRAVDGSKSTSEGFKAVGLDAGKMAAQIAKGGKPAAAGLQAVLDGLRGIKDPVARSQAAVQLFGTKAEDLGASLYALNPAMVATTGGMKDVGGATQQLTDQVGGTTKANLEALSRTFQQSLGSALTTVVPLLNGVLKVIGPLAPVLGPMAVAIGAVAAAQWIWNAALAANPLGLVVIAIAALVAGVILAYQKVGWFRDLVNTAFAAVKNAISAVVTWVTTNWPKLKDILANAISAAKTAMDTAWTAIKGAVTSVKDWIVARWNDVIGFLTGLPGRVKSAATGIWDSITGSATAAKKWVTDKFDGIVSFITGIPDRIRSAAGKIFDPLRSAAIGVFNAIATAWNATLGGMSVNVPGWVPGLGGKGFSFPNMPHFARGGWLPSGWSVVGELGPELVHKAGGSARVFSNTASRDMLRTDTGQQVSIARLVEFSGPVTIRSDQDILDLSRGIARETNRRLRALGTSVSLSGARA